MRPITFVCRTSCCNVSGTVPGIKKVLHLRHMFNVCMSEGKYTDLLRKAWPVKTRSGLGGIMILCKHISTIT